MEFFRGINLNTTEEYLQKYLRLNSLDKLSNEIFNLKTPSEEVADIGGIWGEFTLSRNEINGGIRFALLECPNALCWTVTTGFPPDPESTVIHLTVNRQQISQEFIEEIEEFLDDHSECLKRVLSIEES
ncbi:hypothetical protein A9Q87_12595 [Flavobacteriales bacterium 34_180_T64]|nr:hypothetical protein A9Q87_12595 [Flavobacteriales bacterium 34_180_T64]